MSSSISNISNIQGPVSFRYLEKDEQKIYLFGDRHKKSGIECPNSQHIVNVLK